MINSDRLGDRFFLSPSVNPISQDTVFLTDLTDVIARTAKIWCESINQLKSKSDREMFFTLTIVDLSLALFHKHFPLIDSLPTIEENRRIMITTMFSSIFLAAQQLALMPETAIGTSTLFSVFKDQFESSYLPDNSSFPGAEDFDQNYTLIKESEKTTPLTRSTSTFSKVNLFVIDILKMFVALKKKGDEYYPRQMRDLAVISSLIATVFEKKLQFEHSFTLDLKDVTSKRNAQLFEFVKAAEVLAQTGLIGKLKELQLEMKLPQFFISENQILHTVFQDKPNGKIQPNELFRTMIVKVSEKNGCTNHQALFTILSRKVFPTVIPKLTVG